MLRVTMSSGRFSTDLAHSENNGTYTFGSGTAEFKIETSSGNVTLK